MLPPRIMHKPALVLLSAVIVASFGLQGQPNTHTDTQGMKLTPSVAQRKTLDQVPEQSTTAITASYTAPIASAPVRQVEPVQPVSGSEQDAKMYIYMHESGNNPAAVNASSGACSIGQSLPCSKLSSICPNWQTDYNCDDQFFTDYANQRYGGWAGAQAWWESHKWW